MSFALSFIVELLQDVQLEQLAFHLMAEPSSLLLDFTIRPAWVAEHQVLVEDESYHSQV